MSISLFFTIFAWILGGLVLLYSLVFMRKKANRLTYFAFAFLTLFCASGAFLAEDFITLLMFWGSLLVLLYAMIGVHSFKTAAKSLMIVGIGDFCLMLGIVYLMVVTESVSLVNFVPLATDTPFNALVFLLIAIGAMIKAGIFGFHEWIVEAAETTPSTTMAFLPASLDKLLGIYLLVRVFKDFFIVNEALMVVVMGIGAFTVLLAVLMALIQHDFKKLLAFHAVSQVGYMVLGIASGTVIGLAGGLFHMLNHTIYKTCLFLNAGNIEYRVGKTELSQLGGLNKLMPVTFVGTIIASLSISGVPPFNGFASKWMVYQGLIPQGASWLGAFKMIFLAMAMFGSVLTLASFMKLIYAAFFAEKSEESAPHVTEVPFLMQLPVIILSLFCVILGVFANQLMVTPFLEPMLGKEITYIGTWSADIASVLIVVGVVIGAALFLFSRVAWRSVGSFVGGEVLKGNKVLGAEFYLSVQALRPLKVFYRVSEAGGFDVARYVTGIINFISFLLFYGVDRLMNVITNAIGKLAFVISAGFKSVHNGLLDRYVAWILIGFIILIGVFLRCLNFMQ